MAGEISADYGQSLRSYLMRPEVVAAIERIVPPHLKADRAIREALTLCQLNPDLLSCTPASIYAGLVQASELGLELSGVLGQAYLVPRWNSRKRCREARFQPGYRGLIALAHRTGKVRYLTPRVVYAREAFAVQYGTNHSIFHAPILDGTDRGPAIAYYAVVGYRPSGEDFEVMTRAEVELHRDKFAPAAAAGGPGASFGWASNFDAMALKTVLKRLANRSPLSVEFQAAAAMPEGEDEHESGTMPPPLLSRSEEVAAILEGGEEVPVEPHVEREPGEEG